MADISKITLPSGTTYDIKDAVARDAIANLNSFEYVISTDAATTPQGVQWTSGSTTITGTLVAAAATMYKIYLVPSTNGEKDIYDEYITVNPSGTTYNWEKLGNTDIDLSNLGDLAYKDTASGNFTPAGTVSTPIFTGRSSNVEIGVMTVEVASEGNYRPVGTVSQPTFTGSSTTSTGKYTPSGTVAVSTNGTTNKTATVSSTTGTATYTPAGTVTQPTFTGTQATIESSATYTPAGIVTLSKIGTYSAEVFDEYGVDYAPSGDITAPIISVKTAGTTTTIKNPTSVTVAKTVVTAAPGAAAPSNSLTYYNVTGETLSLYQLGYTTGDSVTTNNVTVKTGDAAYEASVPVFYGNQAMLHAVVDNTQATFTGTEATIDSTATYTPAGTVSQPTFTGTGARLVTGNIPVPSTYTATFTGTEGDVSVTGTPSGSVSQPTFTGVRVLISGSVTPSGTVSKPTFTGTQGTVTVS